MGEETTPVEEKKEEEATDISKETKEELKERSKKDKTLVEIIKDLLQNRSKKKSVLYDEFLPG
jgi:hypothetical protein